MTMEAAQDDVIGCTSTDQSQSQSQSQTQLIKGKRTKRPKLTSPLLLTASPSSPHVPRITDIDGFTDHRDNTTEEEQDMANCLILLAQGRRPPVVSSSVVAEQPIPTKSPPAAGLYVYRCKTCDRCFPSFQALGGHRASHKKPAKSHCNVELGKKTTLMQEEEKEKEKEEEEEDDDADDEDGTLMNKYSSTTLSLQIGSRESNANCKPNKVHECSVCGAEFSSGQALGGHMRRHRIATGLSNSSHYHHQSKKPRNLLQLDLNLPAPEVVMDEDHDQPKFPFSSKEQILVFSAPPPPLVGCHY